MKYLACLLIALIPSLAFAGPADDVRVALALASATKPMPPKPAPGGKCACDVTGCPCGCLEGGTCGCVVPSRKVTVLSGVDDPAQLRSVAIAEYAEFVAWKKAKATKKNTNPKHDQWLAEGWTYDKAEKCYYKYPTTTAGSCANGACTSSSCLPGASSYAPSFSMPAQSYQPSFAQPMQSFGGFGGGFGGGSFGGGGGGCAGGSCR